VDIGKITLGLIQMACAEAPVANLENAVTRIEETAGRGATVICLQELYRSRYFCQTEENAAFDLAEPIPGPTTERLGQVAAERKVVVIAPIFERRAPGVYHNSAVVIDDNGKVAGLYRKMHIPDDPGYYEKFYFTPGDLDFIAHPTSRGSLGVLICWDQWFPEAARLTALSGAQILFYPTAIGWTRDMDPATRKRLQSGWETVQRGHAIANGVFVVAVNRVGVEGEIEFWGNSFVADPFGEVLIRGSSSNEEILIVECDLSLIEETRRNWPFLRDRRIDAYQDLTRRFRT
jgi:N-carbamoylputrescine amidase